MSTVDMKSLSRSWQYFLETATIQELAEMYTYFDSDEFRLVGDDDHVAIKRALHQTLNNRGVDRGDNNRQ